MDESGWIMAHNPTIRHHSWVDWVAFDSHVMSCLSKVKRICLADNSSLFSPPYSDKSTGLLKFSSVSTSRQLNNSVPN